MLNVIKDLNKFNCIKFLDSEHRYFINGKPATTSITSVISKCKAAFDNDKWSKHKAKQRNVDQEVILKEWQDNALFSTQLGTLLHSYIENYWSNKIKKYDQQSMINIFGAEKHTEMRKLLATFIKSFHGMYDRSQHIVPIRSELVIGDYERSCICGMVDMLAFNEQENCFEIYDFKTNKKFTHRNPYKEKFIHPAIAHLDVSDLNSYSLQQSFYKLIIERYTNIRIKNCYLLWFDRSTSSCEKILCTDLTEYCTQILDGYCTSELNLDMTL